MPRLTLIAALALACTAGPDDVAVDTDTDASTGNPVFGRPVRGEAGELKAGVARARIPAPLGIGTAGFGPSFGGGGYPTPFAEIYPGTRRIHGHPEIKVVALSRGVGHEAIFVRIDAVGMFEQLRNDVVAKVEARTGRKLDHALVLGATHTHSGPGRVVNTNSSDFGFFDMIADKFLPEFYDRFVDALVGTIAEALDDLQPARVAFVDTTCPDGHSDRRCEDGPDHTNPAVPVIAVERDGRTDAVILAYAVHGTLFGQGDGYLSQDVHGAIEEAVEDRFDHPVEVLAFNSWGADMSPGSPQGVPHVDHAFLPDGKFRRAREIGFVLADAVHDALGDAAFVDDPEISLETHRFGVNADAIGYAYEEFPYEYGAVYCQGGNECDPRGERIETMLNACIPFVEAFPAPSQTSVTVGRVGAFSLLTFPGEPGTKLAEELMGRIEAAHGPQRFFFSGYTQDYLGYSILEDDWWFGGYEASGALWGPRQGEHLVDRIATSYGLWVTQGGPETPEPPPLQPFPYTIDAPYVPETALDGNTVAVDVLAAYGPGDAIELTVHGQDPWVGAPLAWVEAAGGQPLLRPNGMRVDSDDYNFDVELTPTPSYRDAPRAPRHFAWRFRLPVSQPVEGGVRIPDGEWVVKVSVPQPGGAAPVVVTSDVFVVATP